MQTWNAMPMPLRMHMHMHMAFQHAHLPPLPIRLVAPLPQMSTRGRTGGRRRLTSRRWACQQAGSTSVDGRCVFKSFRVPRFVDCVLNVSSICCTTITPTPLNLTELSWDTSAG